MQISRRHFRVFVSSPSDVATERALAFGLLERLPYDPFLRDYITVETVAWNKPGGGAAMPARSTPQEAINRQLARPSECDIVVVIVWSRMGTPLSPDIRRPDGTRYLSGTEWEYEDAFHSDKEPKPEIFIYRRTEKIAIEPADPEFAERSAQLKNVDAFIKNLLNPDGSFRRSYKEYKKLKDFAIHLERDVKAAIRNLLKGPHEQIRIHLSVGDRFAQHNRYVEALEEYEKALQLDSRNIEVLRRLISTRREKLVRQAFGPDSRSSIALSHDLIDEYFPVRLAPPPEVDAALNALYRLQALNPALKNDVTLLLDEALILKTGCRFDQAITVLRTAHGLDLPNTEVLGELGLLLARYPKNSPSAAEGIRFIRDAIDAKPQEAQFHFYLAHVLAENRYARLEYGGGDEDQAYAEAIREYHRAADLVDGDDIWGLRTLARERSMDIFHRYVRSEGDILTPKLPMPLEERLRELQYLTPKASHSWYGAHDFPEFWIAALHRATGNLEQADREIRAFFEERYSGETIGTIVKSRIIDGILWFELFAKILEERATDPEILATLKAQIAKAKQG